MVAGDNIAESDVETSYCYCQQRMFGLDDAGKNFDEMNHYDNVYGWGIRLAVIRCVIYLVAKVGYLNAKERG